jgi:drug/metabolite transporter (DMT)-like permease
VSDSRESWISAAMLFSYAVSFSFAYVMLSIGTGALILFGAVQLTMVLKDILSCNRLIFAEWIGILLAFGGLVYLVLPGLIAPPLVGALLMAVAGISWGIYSLRGIRAKNPLAETTSNFCRSLAFVAGLVIVSFQGNQLSARGILLSILSGSVASGLGYAVWYTALKDLNVTRAAVVQLIVPVLAALGGIIFLAEHVSIRLIASSMMILGGVGLAVSIKKVIKV